jgi:hypothetical protein
MSCGGGHRLTLDPMGKYSKTTWTVETKLPRNDHWKVLYKVYVFYVDRKSKMAATAIHRLTLDPMGKCSNAFFSETTNIIKAKLYSAKKAFEQFPIGSNVNLCPAVVAILDFRSA